MEAKVENYKDDFVNRLSLQKSFDDGMTASTRHSKTNPLVSASFDTDQGMLDVQETSTNLNFLISVTQRYYDEAIYEKFELLQAPFATLEEKFEIINWIMRFGPFLSKHSLI